MTKKTINPDANSIVFSFEEGEDVVFQMSELSEEIITKLALHGASQKIGDSYAGAAKACLETGADPVEYARASVSQVIAQLVAGDWTVRTGAGGPTATDLSKALAEATGANVDEWAEKLSESTPEEKKALRAHPAVKAILDRYRAERAAAKAAASEGAIEGVEIVLPTL